MGHPRRPLGLKATFAPSVSSEGAGNGLHIHSLSVRSDASTIVNKAGTNDTGRRLIADYLSAAKALTAFGTTVPTSSLRLTAGGETPEGICPRGSLTLPPTIRPLRVGC